MKFLQVSISNEVYGTHIRKNCCTRITRTKLPVFVNSKRFDPRTKSSISQPWYGLSAPNFLRSFIRQRICEIQRKLKKKVPQQLVGFRVHGHIFVWVSSSEVSPEVSWPLASKHYTIFLAGPQLNLYLMYMHNITLLIC